MSHQDDIKKVIVNYNRRLQKLKERQALEGVSVDPKILIEIEDIEAELKRLQTELDGLEVTIPPPLILKRGQADVIIVYDDLDSAHLLTRVIKNWGLSVSSTADPKTALSLVERYQPSSIIFDAWYAKEGKFSTALAKKLKNLCPGIKIIGINVVGISSPSDKMFDIIFHKPMDVDDLADALGARK